MYTEEIIISISTKEKLTEEQASETLFNMQARLQGYSTKSPEFLGGAEINISRNRKVELVKCDSCEGTGEKHDYEERKCHKCDGTGTIDERKLWQKIVKDTKSW